MNSELTLKELVADFISVDSKVVYPWWLLTLPRWPVAGSVGRAMQNLLLGAVAGQLNNHVQSSWKFILLPY